MIRHTRPGSLLSLAGDPADLYGVLSAFDALSEAEGWRWRAVSSTVTAARAFSFPGRDPDACSGLSEGFGLDVQVVWAHDDGTELETAGLLTISATGQRFDLSTVGDVDERVGSELEAILGDAIAAAGASSGSWQDLGVSVLDLEGLPLQGRVCLSARTVHDGGESSTCVVDLHGAMP